MTFFASIIKIQTYHTVNSHKLSPAYDKITKAIFPEPTSVPIYSYNYIVDDPRSGDTKSHQEIRQGNVVKGSYSFIEPDGTRRTVDYTVDSVNGFNAIVKKELITTHKT